jgi:preprotein translocase SecE subunit
VADKKELKKKDDIRKVKTSSVRKPKATLRQRNVKAAEDKGKTKRIRRAASNTAASGKKVGSILTTEFHLTDRKEKPGFLSKSRSLTPRYLSNSWQEIRQVVWPGRKETWKLVFAVFVFSIFVGGFIAVLDFGLEKLFRAVIL